MERLQFAVTKSFKKNFKSYRELYLHVDFIEVLYCLMHQKPLAEKYKDHQLTGNLSMYRECHIKPDLLLAYYFDLEHKRIVLSAIGNHNNLFKDLNK